MGGGGGGGGGGEPKVSKSLVGWHSYRYSFSHLLSMITVHSKWSLSDKIYSHCGPSAC